MHAVLTVNAAWNILNFRRPIVQALLDRGARVTALAPADDAVPALRDMGCEFRPLAMDAKGLNPVQGMALYRQLRREFTAAAPDIVLSWTIKNNIFGAMAATDLRLPFVPNVSGLGTAFMAGGLIRLVAETLYRRAFRGLPVVFFQNAEDRALFIERRLLQAGQARLLPGSGIDLEHFSPAPPPPDQGAPTFLMIGRLLRDKGVLEYVAAAQDLRARHPNVRFRLLGAADASNRTAIDAATVAGWVDAGIIDYLGTAPDVRPHIAAADCIVLPSYREGAPRTLIEAGAMARPVIATDVPGCRSVVTHEVTGLLCAPRNAQALGATFEHFLALPAAARAAMGAAGRARMVRDFDQRHVVAAYEAAVAALVSGR